MISPLVIWANGRRRAARDRRSGLSTPTSDLSVSVSAANHPRPMVLLSPATGRRDVSRGDGGTVAGDDAVTGRTGGLAGLAGFLDRFLLPLVLVVAGLGVAFPAPGRHLDAHGAILITLAVLVFCTGS